MSWGLLCAHGKARRCTGNRTAVARDRVSGDTERQELTERRTTRASAIGPAACSRRDYVTATRRLAAIVAAQNLPRGMVMKQTGIFIAALAALAFSAPAASAQTKPGID